MDGVKLDITTDAVREIARLAKERNTGARGLRAIMEGLMLEYMYSLPSDKTADKITFTAEVVKGEKKAEISRAEKDAAPKKKAAATTKTTKKATVKTESKG